MNKIYLVTIIVSVCFVNCRENHKPTVIEPSADLHEKGQSIYPGIIDSLGLQKQFDKAKWVMYCILCDDTVKFKESSGVKAQITFASLDLRFEEVLKQQDSIELHFSFYKDTLRCDSWSMKNFPIINGVVFKKDSVLCYSTPTTLRYFWKTDTNSRYVKPLQPEVINYIRSNKEKLHPWFREAAVKAKIIQ